MARFRFELGPVPLHHQVYLDLRSALDTGEWRPGDLLPPERQLAGRYGCSLITVRRALGELAREGRLERTRGRGTTVLPPRIERALYRVANEAFTNAWRHARCLIIRAQLTFTDDEVQMVIFDDGIGLDMRHPQTGIHMGMASMRRSMSDVGGSLRVRPAKPRGLQMEVKVRTDKR